MTDTETDNKELQIDASDGIDGNELQTMKDAIGNNKEKEEIITQLQESVRNQEPNTIKEELEKAIQNAGLDNKEATKIIEAYNLLFGGETQNVTPEAKETNTSKTILGLDLKEINENDTKKNISEEKAYKLNNQLEKSFGQYLNGADRSNVIALIQYMHGKLDGKDSFILDDDESKEFIKMMKNEPTAEEEKKDKATAKQEIKNFFDTQFNETIATGELFEGLDNEHPLKERESLVNNLDFIINNALNSDLPNVPVDIRRNIATVYTIAMLEHVGSLDTAAQEKLAKDLEPKEGNFLDQIKQLADIISVNKDAGEFFGKYDKFNNEIIEISEGKELTTEDDFRKYEFFANPSTMLESFRGFEDGKPITGLEGNFDYDGKKDDLLKDMKDSVKDSPELKNLSSNAIQAMDTLANDLNSTKKDINSMKSLLESGEYTDTIKSLTTLPVVGEFFKGIMDMVMKLFGYENGVSQYLEKMDSKDLKKTSKFIIDDLNPEEGDKKLKSGIFDGVTGFVAKSEDSDDKVQLHSGFADGMTALGKDFKNNEEVAEFLNTEGLNKFITEDIRAINSEKVDPNIQKIAKEIKDGEDKINLSHLSTLVKIYGEFTSENQELAGEGEAEIGIEKFLEREYPVAKKKEEEKSDSDKLNKESKETAEAETPAANVNKPTENGSNTEQPPADSATK